jgi:hypothetical protein
VEFKVKDLRSQAFDFLDEKNMKFDQFTTEMRNKAISYEKELLSFYSGKRFMDFYETHSIPKLNKKIKDRLRSYFKNKPAIQDMINSIRHYYE